MRWLIKASCCCVLALSAPPHSPSTLRAVPAVRPQGHINQLMAANNLLFSCSQDNSIRVWGMEGEAFVCKVGR